MKTEREHGPLGARRGQPRPELQHVLDHFLAAIDQLTCLASQLLRGIGKRARCLRTHEVTIGRIHPDPEVRLDPCGQRVLDKLVVRHFTENPSNTASDRRVIVLVASRHPGQRLDDDTFVLEDRYAEDPARDSCNFTLATLGHLGRHRGRSSDALQTLRSGCITQSADQHRNVRTLPTAIGVQLVQHEELQAGGRSDQALPLVRPGQQEFEHDVVREENVRRIREDVLAVSVAVLPGVAAERHRLSTCRIAPLEEFLELQELAVGQGVHRVDDDGLDTGAIGSSQVLPHDPIDDGDDIGKALTGAGARGQNVAQPTGGNLDRFALMTMKIKWFACHLGSCDLSDPEDPRALSGQHALLDERIDRAAGLEVRIQRDERVRPLVTVLKTALDVPPNALVTDLGEPRGERLVVSNELLVNLKDIHTLAPRHSRSI